MRLSELKTGERAVVVKVYGHGGFRKRITEMGFVKGKEVSVVKNAPLEDPIEYEIIGYRLTLRRKEAEMVEVVSESEAGSVEALPLGNVNSEELDEQDRTLLEAKMASLADEHRKRLRVALVGNPNCGKTCIYNVASGNNEHVGNWGGVTVDVKEGHFTYGGYTFTLVDLPGTYSLSSYSPEELYVRNNIVDGAPDIVINVVDASNIERNLYLTTQLIDMNLRMVMALNMYDEMQAKGDSLDISTLGKLLGVPIVPTVGRTGKGVTELFDAVIKLYENTDPGFARHIHINYGEELEKSIGRIKDLIWEDSDVRAKYSTRFLAIKYLEDDKDAQFVVETLKNRDEIIAARVEEDKRYEDLMGGTTINSAIADAKYAFIQGALKETYTRGRPEDCKQMNRTNKIDRIVTNKWLAFPIFFVLLYLIFQVTFTLGDYPMQWIEWLVEKFGEFVGAYMADGWLKDLIVDGVIGGVGAVLVFLPNILFLYFFISILDDSGYMARAAFIMDRVMHKMGLHGKSFIPMIMGFGCNVPAIMAARTIESPKSRLVTMLIVPLMSCAGRLPVYVLIAGAFFPRQAGLVLLGLYVLGIILAVVSAKIVSPFLKDDDLPFVMELPPYRVPTVKSVCRHTWEKGKQYLKKMAGIILICSVVIWVLGYFPHHDAYETAELQQENSYIGHIGKAIEPALEPLGFDWKMGVGLIAGVCAKELVVSTLGVMYSVLDNDGNVIAIEQVDEIGGFDAQDAVDVWDADYLETGDISMDGSDALIDKNDVEVYGAGTVATDDRIIVDETIIVEETGMAEDLDADTALQRALLRTITSAAALAYMVFILLYFPCIATFVAIKNETGKWRWAILSAVYTIVLAWLMAFLTYHIALLF